MTNYDIELALCHAAAVRSVVKVRVMDGSQNGSCNIIGSVVQCSAQLFVIAEIVDAHKYDGWSIHRVSDVSEIESPYIHHEFISDALRLRSVVQPSVDELSLGGFVVAVASVATLQSVVSVVYVSGDESVCDVGVIVASGDDHFLMRTISPDGDWIDDIVSVAIDSVVWIEFGGEYDRSLLMVANSRYRRET